MIWAATIPLYFIDDDFAHLSAAQSPPLESLWELTTRGAEIVPASCQLCDHFPRLSSLRHAPAGYHITNLFIHLVAIAGLFYLENQRSHYSQLRSKTKYSAHPSYPSKLKRCMDGCPVRSAERVLYDLRLEVDVPASGKLPDVLRMALGRDDLDAVR